MSTSSKDIPLAHIEDAKNTGVATPVESLDSEKGDDNSLSNQDWDEAEEKALMCVSGVSSTAVDYLLILT